ncbi:hypothetical protein CDL15_Pgr022033 [Punica granatum]|uniref:Splicing factor Cactin n=1 Tax=Punica granatum TaxID=22663 RepID=A0A218VSV9_PUNGR|nr:hypothetical protein CDL15_Pgr022033 [Punica granatum]
MALLSLECTRAEFRDWEKKEREFDFNDLDIELVFKSLTVKAMEELRDDIKMCLHLDKEAPKHVKYWKALLVVCEFELGEARRKDALNRAPKRGEEPPAELLGNEERGKHASIKADVKYYLQRKTYKELKDIHFGAKSLFRSGTAKVVDFCEVILRWIDIYKAKALLKEQHYNTGAFSLEWIEREATAGPDEEAGSFFPQLLHGDDNKDAINSKEDRAALEQRRLVVLQEQRWHQAAIEDKFKTTAMKGMETMDVHIGYKWSKYSQIYYDQANLPPKIVQGYKFNIFYPTRFHAGPPYEDIAFRIVEKEWVYSHKKGFECTFESGILRLYFNFKRYYYQRRSNCC